MKTSSPKKEISPIYFPNDMHRRISTVAKHRRLKIGEYVVSKISTLLTRDESTMRDQIQADHNRNSSKAG